MPRTQSKSAHSLHFVFYNKLISAYSA